MDWERPKKYACAGLCALTITGLVGAETLPSERAFHNCKGYALCEAPHARHKLAHIELGLYSAPRFPTIIAGLSTGTATATSTGSTWG